MSSQEKIEVPDPVVKGSIKEWHAFDHPDRSFRGRTITHAAFIDLGSGPLPRVKGADDAEKAFWVKLSELDGKEMFEDHIDIIRYFVGGLL